MLKKIIMPSAGQTTDTATITKICVSVGDKIRRGHVVAEVETDKATLPIESFADGYICAVYIKEFDVIDSGTPLFAIGNETDLAGVSEKSTKSADTTTEAASDVEYDDFTPVIKSSKTVSAPKAKERTDTEKSAPTLITAPTAPALSNARLSDTAPAMPGAKKLAAELGIYLGSITPANGSFIKTADVRAAAQKHISHPNITAPAADFSALRDYIKHITENIGIPSAAVTVWRAHQEVYYCQAGVQDRKANKPLNRDALYNMYSCTKPVTCVAALQLLESGKLILLDKVSDYLPEFADVQVGHVGYTVPAKNPMLIRDLFTMSSGLTYNLASANINDVITSSGGRCPTREVVKAISASPLSFDPSTRFLYGLSHDVLAALVEVVSGMKFSEYVKKNIFDPLGMIDSGFRIETIDKSRMAAQYRYNEKTKEAVQIELTNTYVIGSEYESGGAGIISTLDDYIRFSDALACGGTGATGARILAPSTINLMRTNQLDQLRMEDFHRAFTQFRGYGYGLGVRTHIDRTAGSLSPHGEFGWAGAAGAYLLVDPEHQLSIFYIQHMLNSQERIVHPRIRNITYACLGL